MEPELFKEHPKENSGPNLVGTLSSNKYVHSSSSSSSLSSSHSSSSLGSDFGDEGNLSGPENISSENTPESLDMDEKFGMQNPPRELSPMKSPPVQTMGLTPGYDLNRIPFHVFSTKGANTAEWSAASNESLFSLRMANNSFSNDYAILFGKSGELSRSFFKASGELPRLGEWDHNAQSKSDNLSSVAPAIRVPMEELDKLLRGEKRDDSNNQNLDPVAYMDSNAREKLVTTGQGVNICGRISMESDTKEKQVTNTPGPDAAKISVESDAYKKPITDQSVNSKRTDMNNVAPKAAPPAPSASLNFPSPPRSSGESGISGSSFAFPALVNGSEKLAGSLKGIMEKPEESEPQSQPQPKVEEEAPTKSRRRLSCFLCFPQCC